MKIQIFKKQKKLKKENFTVNINFYWKLILCVAFAVVILSFVFGFYLFEQVNKESTLSPNNTSGTAETVPKERIQKVLEYFSQREKKSAGILSSPSPVIDPSL